MVRFRRRLAITFAPFSAGVAALLGVALTHGCGGDSSGPSQPTLSGRWALVSIDDGALPHAVRQTRVGSVDVVSGVLRFGGSVVSDTLRFAASEGGTAAADTTVQGERAAYLLRGDTLLVTRARIPVSWVDTGFVAGDTLRLTVQRIEPQNTTPFALRYQKTP